MNNHYNTALLFIRMFGLICIFLSILGLLFFLIFLFSLWFKVPDWFSQSLAAYAMQSLVTVPLWFIGGVIVIRSSHRIASFATKGIN